MATRMFLVLQTSLVIDQLVDQKTGRSCTEQITGIVVVRLVVITVGPAIVMPADPAIPVVVAGIVGSVMRSSVVAMRRPIPVVSIAVSTVAAVVRPVSGMAAIMVAPVAIVVVLALPVMVTRTMAAVAVIAMGLIMPLCVAVFAAPCLVIGEGKTGSADDAKN